MSASNESKIPLLSPEEATAAAAEVEIPDAMAQLNVFRLLLRRPRLAKDINSLLLTLLFQSTLDHRLRELVIMRIGWATGSNYEWTQHWRVAQEQFDVSAEDLLALRDWRGSDRFGPAERAVLTATDETLEGGRITPATLEACRKHLPDDDALLELTASIGCWRLISQLARTLEIPLEDGVADWPPEGTPSPADE